MSATTALDEIRRLIWTAQMHLEIGRPSDALMILAIALKVADSAPKDEE